MQVEVSMYFETVGSVRMPVVVPHIDAEEDLISSVCATISRLLLRFVESDKEGLVLGGPGVRVARRRGQEIRQRPGVIGRAGVAPVDRESDLPDAFAVDIHDRQALGDPGRPLGGAAR